MDLEKEPVDELATRATAQVIDELDADVLAVVEVESRPALDRFSRQLLARPYAHAMLIDGNDERGIDVGLLTRARFPITKMLSHADDADPQGRIFSRDCAEYWIRTPKGHDLVLLVNHFKSQGYGPQPESDARRARQARRVAQIYRSLRAQGAQHIAVVGDLNDAPTSPPLASLLSRTDLRDASEHPTFDDGGRPGTFGAGTAAEKFDYLLLSPALFKAMTKGGLARSSTASDHAAIWAKLMV